MAAGPGRADIRLSPGRPARAPVSVWYLDTSVALKLLIEEAESPALAEAVDSEQPDLVASGSGSRIEARRKVWGMLGMAAISDFLTGVSLYEMPGSSLREAGILPGETLRSLDALHLAAAVRVGVDLVLTHDERMASRRNSWDCSFSAPVSRPGFGASPCARWKTLLFRTCCNRIVDR